MLVADQLAYAGVGEGADRQATPKHVHNLPPRGEIWCARERVWFGGRVRMRCEQEAQTCEGGTWRLPLMVGVNGATPAKGQHKLRASGHVRCGQTDARTAHGAHASGTVTVRRLSVWCSVDSHLCVQPSRAANKLLGLSPVHQRTPLLPSWEDPARRRMHATTPPSPQSPAGEGSRLAPTTASCTGIQ